MKKISIILTAIGIVAFMGCDPATYEDISPEVPEVVTYSANVRPIIENSCLSCHSVATDNQEPNLETYENVKHAVEEHGLLDQIAAPSGQGMPQDLRLPQPQIDLITIWAQTGFNP
ncbi:hypothetical protein [Flavobacterium silvaticum]|uniref:Cytochrome c domain-containing protein n=1 Tax=Flavobacterium silvaticum TaxID=1852020 RepID=A0A972FQC0_9FLAO|nr:hypothetical protein [Flavobacterium silvaticum]NMH29410.1 hypothetical protein [Flavobacterium silvaticum]